MMNLGAYVIVMFCRHVTNCSTVLLYYGYKTCGLESVYIGLGHVNLIRNYYYYLYVLYVKHDFIFIMSLIYLKRSTFL